MPRQYAANIYVTLKPTVNDPQGLTVRGGLRNLGFDSVDSVRVGKYIHLTLSASDSAQASQRVDDMCKRLLAKPRHRDLPLRRAGCRAGPG